MAEGLDLGGAGGGNGLNELFVLEVAGLDGSRELSFASGTSIADIASAVNSFTDVTGVRAVLNGTTNFVLSRLIEGAAPGDAVRAARLAGLAEEDPSHDLSGADALDKLRIIAQCAGLTRLAISDASCRPLDAGTSVQPRAGAVVRQTAAISPSGRAQVTLERISPGDPLFDLPDEWNAALLTWDDGEQTLLRGRGAGRWPTAESVFADALALARRQQPAPAAPAPAPREALCHVA